MFTGIVQGKAQVSSVFDQQVQGNLVFRRFRLQFPTGALAQLQRGASIAIHGTCLTATDFAIAEGWVEFDVIDETLRKTNLGLLTVGDAVNFERSLKFGDEIGGHLVSGHVHGTGVIRDIAHSGDNWAIEVAISDELRRYVWPKGFIAVNGASLTVGDVTEDSFFLHLIPETLALTCFGQANVGDLVNLEVDQQARQLQDLFQSQLTEQIRQQVRDELQKELASIQIGLD